MTPDSDVIILCRRIMASESGVIICLHSIKTSADLLKRKRFTHGTLCSKSRSNEDSGTSIFSVKKILPRGKGQHFFGHCWLFLYLRGFAVGSITYRVVI